MSDSTRVEFEVSVFIGEQLVETRVCRGARTPEGESGVVYRGLVHPLLDGGRIDLAGPAFIPETYDAAPTSSRSECFSFLWGDRSGYLLVEGSVANREAAASALRAAGAYVLRAGRYLGDPLEGLSPDWFVRFDNLGQAPDVLERAVSEILAIKLHVGGDSNKDKLRLKLIGIEVAEARLQAAALRAENARLRVERVEAKAAQDVADLNAAERVDAERAQLIAALAEEARARVEAEAIVLESRTPPPAVMTATGSLKSEIETVIDVLLPHVHLLRDSLLVIAVEYRDRKSLYRALAQLNPSLGRPPTTWKKLAGLEYWERHISDGASDAGRVYAWLDTRARMFRVLVSRKSEQTRDIAWLRQRGSLV